VKRKEIANKEELTTLIGKNILEGRSNAGKEGKEGRSGTLSRFRLGKSTKKLNMKETKDKGGTSGDKKP